MATSEIIFGELGGGGGSAEYVMLNFWGSYGSNIFVISGGEVANSYHYALSTYSVLYEDDNIKIESKNSNNLFEITFKKDCKEYANNNSSFNLAPLTRGTDRTAGTTVSHLYGSSSNCYVWVFE